MKLDRNILKKNEIDLLYLGKKFSKGLFGLILATGITSTFGTLLISTIFERKFVLSVDYNINMISPDISNFCQGNSLCEKLETKEEINNLLGDNWNPSIKLDYRLDSKAHTPIKFLTSIKYYSEINQINNKLREIEKVFSDKVLLNYKQKHDYLLSISNEHVMNTDTYVKSRIATKDYINALEQGKKVLVFKSPKFISLTYGPNIDLKPPLLELNSKDNQLSSLNFFIFKNLMIIFFRIALITFIFYSIFYIVRDSE